MIEYENLGLLNKPYFSELENSFKQSMLSGWYVLGSNVSEFEKRFAEYLGVEHCIGVGNGLDAMTLSLLSLELPKGSEVIVPSNTYIATILSVFHAGLTPVLVEPDPSTYNICPKKLESAITEKTKAVLVVHLYGKPCQMDEITALCDEHSLVLLEDCAQSHGAKFKGQNTGTFGLFGCFSFYPTKNLGALGDAGAIVTDDELFAKKLRSLRNYGSQVKYKNQYIGLNSRLDELQAGFLLKKLPYLDDLVSHKRKLAKIYQNGLTDSVIKPNISEDCYDAFHIYNILTDKRDALKEYLLDCGIKTEIHYPIPPSKQEAMNGILDNSMTYPISDRIHGQTLSLPISGIHTEEQVLTVIESINLFFSKHDA